MSQFSTGQSTPETPETPDAPEGHERPGRSRLPLVIAVVASVVVLLLAVAVPLVVQKERAGSTQKVDASTATLDDVQVFENLPRDHVEGDVDYDQTPPVGGPHDPVWLDCGVYDAPVRDENAVHDLEHGAVWISYSPDLSADDVAKLAEQLPQNGIMAPYVGLPSPVVVTVWERQLDLTGADDPRLPMFLAGFSDGHTAPEPFASCAGGERDPGTVGV
ncbi:hypothetical protein FB382_002058 [Nocardioides ginsengisegetis]|uniref:DUF3105 domain-containing protein n=1 Tax=Nocardioides ginsengisegetis TaxID=661491 RepID=A0A7W3J022_9ACTN|nr:DUF3105 domain-containing protein [Nocardioides ginsengisegetis]MBA8803767.1 hypothetical protein [Nocardioides ginsengisegetis]